MRAGGEELVVWRVEEVLQVEVGREEAHESAGACEFSLALYHTISLPPFHPLVLFSLAHCDNIVAVAVMMKP